jgi:2-haloacid dehalogenase|tara:strand:+ start:4771 stop:5496 length:726 start_codon:yes stop_codon:yes gene_type:complete
MEVSLIKALTFDVGGTILDWHTGVSKQLEALGKKRDIKIDWGSFVNIWRQAASMRIIDSKTSDLPRGNIDGVNREVLDQVLTDFGISGFSNSDKDEMTLFWHQIPAWPDAASGIKRLKKKFIVSTLTILSTSLILQNSRKESLYWDSIISCEMLEWYKFHPSAYSRCAELLGCKPQEVVMVAAHNSDLVAASKVGFRTAFIERTQEYGEDKQMNEAAAERDIFTPDFNVENLEELAEALEA